MTTLDLNKLKRDWEKACDHHETRFLRRGQMLFNMLHDRFPKIANSLVGSPLDPFYNNDRITNCLRHLAHLAGENDIKITVFGRQSVDEPKEEKERSFEMEILRYIQKRMAKEDIPRTEGEMV